MVQHNHSKQLSISSQPAVVAQHNEYVVVVVHELGFKNVGAYHSLARALLVLADGTTVNNRSTKRAVLRVGVGPSFHMALCSIVHEEAVLCHIL